jgi:catechol 2,3-dioxygenase-like lactoylglutathione lyase family enzyme
MVKFVSPLVVVDEMARARYFYEQLLGQKVRFDFGPNVTFQGDFALHLRSHFESLLGEELHYPVTGKANWGELYFESDELEPVYQRLSEAGVEFIHAICEQPWGQRVMRLHDPDGHVVEIGETMEAVVWRFHGQGFSVDRIMEKSAMPRDFIEQVIQERTESGRTDSVPQRERL